MKGHPLRYGWGVLREVAVGVAVWLTLLTSGFLLVRFVAPVPPVLARRTGTLWVVDQPLWRGWLTWLWNYTTFGYGVSVAYDEPVRSIAASATGWTLLLLVTAGLVVAVLAVPVVTVLDRLRSSRLAPLATVLVSLPGTVTALAIGYLLWVAVVALTGLTRWGSGFFGQVTVLLAMAAALALPPLGWVLRRASRGVAEAQSTRALLRDLGGESLRLSALHLWAGASYATGAVLVVEQLFGYPGIGFYWTEAVFNRDLSLFLGLTATLLGLSVAAGVGRNVLWTVGGVMSTAPDERPETRGDGPDTGQVRADGGTARRAGSTASTDVARATDGPSVGAVARAVVVRPRTLLGLAWLGAVTAVGVLGSALLTPEPAALSGGGAVAFGPGQVLNSLGSLAVVALGAVILGGIPGALAGALAGLLESVLGGIPGRAASTALRLPTDLVLAVPVLLGVGTWFFVVGHPGTRPAGELLLVVFGGAVAGAYAFRTAQAAVGATPDDWTAGSRVLAALPTGVDGSIEAALVTAFTACELTFLGLVSPAARVPAFQQLGNAFRRAVGTPLSGTRLGAFLQAVVPLVLVAVGLFLLGDGLTSGASAIRRRHGTGDIRGSGDTERARGDGSGPVRQE